MLRSRKLRDDQLQGLGKRNDSFSDPPDVVQIQHWYAGIGERSIAHHRDDTLVGHMECWTPDGFAKNLQFRMRLPLEALNQDKITRAYLPQEFSQSCFGLIVDLVNLDPTPRRRHDDLARTSLAMLMGVLARMIDIECVMSVLDRRHSQATSNEQRDKLRQKCRLARSAPAGKTNDARTAHGLEKTENGSLKTRTESRLASAMRVRSVSLAIDTASSVGAEMVTSIGIRASTAFCTSS